MSRSAEWTVTSETRHAALVTVDNKDERLWVLNPLEDNHRMSDVFELHIHIAATDRDRDRYGMCVETVPKRAWGEHYLSQPLPVATVFDCPNIGIAAIAGRSLARGWVGGYLPLMPGSPGDRQAWALYAIAVADAAVYRTVRLAK
jgi:hypothetical protein